MERPWAQVAQSPEGLLDEPAAQLLKHLAGSLTLQALRLNPSPDPLRDALGYAYTRPVVLVGVARHA